MIGKGNRSTRRKPAPVPLCPPQSPHAARTRTRAAAVGSHRLTAELRHGQISLYYSTHKNFSSLPDFQLSTELSRLLHHLPTAKCQSNSLLQLQSLLTSLRGVQLYCQIWTDSLSYFFSVRVRVRVIVTLRLAVYLQSVRLGDKPLETHDQHFFNWILAFTVLR
jgi:hypothetical protein